MSLFLRLQLLFVLFLGLAQQTWGQSEVPKGDLTTPYDALRTHLYYLQEGSYDLNKAARVIPASGKEAQRLALKIKQIYDGKGLRIRYNLAPEDPDYTDSISKKQIYAPFPERLPEIYLEKNPRTQRWQYSRESLAAIPRLHEQIYPLGSDVLINLLPEWGQYKFLGLAIWQYLAIVLFIFLSLLIYYISRFIFNKIIRLLARANLGTEHLDQPTVERVAKLGSYLLVSYLVYFLLPILQLSVGLSFYLITGLRVANTVFVISILLGLIDLVYLVLVERAKATEHKSDDQWVPIIMRTLKVLIWVGGIIQVLGILEINITALVAGLSIGGLAIALAAQETVRNLFGSLMIIADKQFQVGDMITAEGITGTVEDIGFRSTRIRTLDSSLVTIPNGNLTNVVINNLGARRFRRFSTQIAIAYHTPPELIEAFVKGLREINLGHHGTRNDQFFIHLHDLTSSSINILFTIFFDHNDYALEVKYREEIIFAMIRLAKQLGVQFAYPLTSVYIESTPTGSVVPTYKQNIEEVETRLQAFLVKYQAEQEAKLAEEAAAKAQAEQQASVPPTPNNPST